MIKLYDLHSDLPTSLINKSTKLIIAKNNQKLGYNAINAIYRGNNSLQNSIKIAKIFKNAGLDIAFEDCCFANYIFNGLTPSYSKINSLIKILCDLNAKYISLGWNYDNLFCGGCKEGGSLTKHGVYAIKLINGYGVAVDCSHANQKSFYAICENSKRVICSHTAFSWIFAHKRNITKEQVKAIILKKGIIGVIGVGHFLSGVKGSIKNYQSAFYEHIQGFLQEFGANNLAIGSDFFGSDAPVFLEAKYHFLYEILNKLAKSGVSENDIKRIAYKNAQNYFNQPIGR